MRCKQCGYNLGEGMLPARCPMCGANLAQMTDKTKRNHYRSADTSRKSVEGISGYSNSDHNMSTSKKRAIICAVLGVIVIGTIIAFFMYGPFNNGSNTMPDVVGWNVEKAKSELEGLGLNVVTEEVASEEFEPGQVVSQDPAAEARIDKGDKVVLKVSKLRPMPDLVGKTRTEAEELLKAAGITYEVEEIPASADKRDIVLKQSLAAEKNVVIGTKIRVTVGMVPTVPDCVGKSQNDAQMLLEKAGYTAKIKTIYSKEVEAGTVVSTNPAAGEALEYGSQVEVSVAGSLSKESEATANAVIDAIYNTTPSGDSIGAALAPYISPESSYSGASAHEIWWGMVKQGGKHSDVDKNLLALPRTIISKSIDVTDGGTGCTATVSVKWYWDNMGASYAGVTSQDTHTISMTFDKDGKLVTFSDPQTDVPTYKVQS